jgi:prolyl-tRNA editing enzyme YbaK/EbsC (Cys-tRNA(Pro) deacylase)
MEYMNIDKLKFNSISDRPDLLAEPVRKYLASLNGVSPADVAVAEIDPTYAGGEELCAHYDSDPSVGGNCIIVESKRADRKWYAACLVPIGSRIDLNGFVRKHLNARRVSLAPKDEAITLTNMEYGSINVVGLPNDWVILVDASFIAKPTIIMGSGLVNRHFNHATLTARRSYRAMPESPEPQLFQALHLPKFRLRTATPGATTHPYQEN